jgi:hypothetical protein
MMFSCAELYTFLLFSRENQTCVSIHSSHTAMHRRAQKCIDFSIDAGKQQCILIRYGRLWDKNRGQVAGSQGCDAFGVAHWIADHTLCTKSGPSTRSLIRVAYLKCLHGTISTDLHLDVARYKGHASLASRLASAEQQQH